MNGHRVGGVITDYDGDRRKVARVGQSSNWAIDVVLTEPIPDPFLCRMGFHRWESMFEFLYVMDTDEDFGIVWEQSCKNCQRKRSVLSQGTE